MLKTCFPIVNQSIYINLDISSDLSITFFFKNYIVIAEDDEDQNSDN